MAAAAKRSLAFRIRESDGVMFALQGQDTNFMSSSGRQFLVRGNQGMPTLYSPDGKQSYVAYEKSESAEKGHICLPQLSLEFDFYQHDDVVEALGEIFVAQDRVNHHLFAVPRMLPDHRQPEYLGVSNKGNAIVYVTSNRYKDDVDTYRLFVGNGRTMREIGIVKTSLLYHGRLLSIYTRKGVLFVFREPAFDAEGVAFPDATWSNMELTTVPRTDIPHRYLIDEDESGRVVSIVRK